MMQHAHPLSFNARMQLLEAWCDANPYLLGVIEMSVVQQAMSGKRRILTAQLIDQVNAEFKNQNAPVFYLDQNDVEHTYRPSAVDAVVLGKFVHDRRPTLGVEYYAQPQGRR